MNSTATGNLEDEYGLACLINVFKENRYCISWYIYILLVEDTEINIHDDLEGYINTIVVSLQ